MSSRRVLSLFAGCGGLDLGFEDAGFEIPLALDNQAAAVASYNRNRKDSPARVADLLTTHTDTLCKWWDSVSAEPPIGVIGGPPCQAFSIANHRQGPLDARRELPMRFATIVKELTERYDLRFFLFENVAGLLGPRHRAYLDALKTALVNAGYPTVDTMVLNSAHFNVAQQRKRLFLVGTRGDDREILRSPSGHLGLVPSVRDAIGHLPEPALFVRGVTPAQIGLHPNHWAMQPRSRRFREGQSLPGDMKARSFRRLRWDVPSWTVSYGHREVHVHPNGHRRLSVLEAMLLQGFPEAYELEGTLSDQFRLVSDAVPPPVGRALGESVLDMLDRQEALSGHTGHIGLRGLQTFAPRSTSA